MFKVEGDNLYTNAYAATDYYNGSTGAKVTITLMPHVMDLLRRLETMEREWQDQKKFIESNPAVKEAYKTYMTMIQLAKEPA